MRLLQLFDRWGIKTTWFIPGHSIETFPKEMKEVHKRGHEIGAHGYSHENPIAMTREQETIVLDKSIELIKKITGKKPRGYVAPWWEFSNVTNELLLERGILYDHSLMHHDFLPYYVRVDRHGEDRIVVFAIDPIELVAPHLLDIAWIDEAVAVRRLLDEHHRRQIVSVPIRRNLDEISFLAAL